MNDNNNSRKGSPIEQIQNISDLERNDDNGSQDSSPGFQLRRGPGNHSTSASSSHIVGVLKELKDDIIDCNQDCNTAGRSRRVSKSTTGRDDVFIEQNGKFIKAPKELLENSEFNTREVYLEEMGSGFLTTPLDIALSVERACSTFSRLLLGILAGAALLTFIIIIILLNLWNINQVIDSWKFLAIITEVCQTLFYVLLTICLVSMLDWLDLAHANLQHIIDTFENRKILFVLVIYLFAFIIFLMAAPYNDYIIYNFMKISSDHNYSQTLIDEEKQTIGDLQYWKMLSVFYLVPCFLGWFILVSTHNEDLFYIHLLGMKKYEDNPPHLTYENEAARGIYN